MTPALRFRRVPADGPPADALIAAMVEEVSALYGRSIAGPGLPSADPHELEPPHGACLVGERDGEPVAVGAIKRLGDGVAEIKRMYVVPAERGGGVARALLGALEDEARRLGYARARLDTGPSQHAARALYRSAGFREIPDYNDNPFADFWGEKEL